MNVPSIFVGAETRACAMPARPDDDAWAVPNLPTPSWAIPGGRSGWWSWPPSSPTVLARRCQRRVGTGRCLKAAYRFFDNVAVDPQAILESHVRATSDRLAAVPRVLAVQDTTEVDWTAHPATTGLGPLAAPTHQGLHVHTTLALTPERLPLGLLAQQVWARDPAAVGKRTTRKHRPIADQESQQWLTSVEAVREAHACCPQSRSVCVGDREADVYHLSLQQRPSGAPPLPRAAWNRRVDHPERYLWIKVAAQPVVATLTVRVPRRGPQPARQATVAARRCPLPSGPPRTPSAESCPPWRSGPSRLWSSSRRPAVTPSSGCC